MNPIKLFLLVVICVNSAFTQEKTTFKDRLYCADMSSIYHYTQLKFSWLPTNLVYGIQYKRLKSDNEAGVFTFITGQSFALNYTKLNDIDFYNTHLETHFRSYPLTYGIIRIGAGIDYTTNFNQTNIFSVFPSIGLDIGGIEINYSYLINGNKSTEFSDHRLSLAIGLWVKSKKI
jgi:hypothetical protein